MNNCGLCYNHLYRDNTEFWNKSLFDFPNFIVLPSLGSLVEGWLLLIPKKHFICMGALPDSLIDEMEEIKQFLWVYLQQTYGSVLAFEHGPSKSNLKVGCGVDHAHLHFVPVDVDLILAASPFLPQDLHWSEAGLEECRDAFTQGKDYLYVEQSIGVGSIITSQEFGSQLFRRAIAANMGVLKQFNWREHPQYSNILATIDKVRSWDTSIFSSMSRPKAVAQIIA